MRLGITTIQRDRSPWIKEWVAFHYLVGFRKFYFFAHNCSDNTAEIVAGLKKYFDIELFILGPDSIRPQMKCYQYSINNFLLEVDWMAFIDSDEFLFPAHDESMEAALSEFDDKKISAFGIYWASFGSGGHIEEPSGLIIENYRYRADLNFKDNSHIKSIVRGRGEEGLVRIGGTPHLFETTFGTFDEKLRQVTHGLTNYKPVYDKFRINHYVCQSRSYFLNFKCRVKTPDGSDSKNEFDWWEYDKNEILDNSMDRFIGPLKNILNSL